MGEFLSTKMIIMQENLTMLTDVQDSYIEWLRELTLIWQTEVDNLVNEFNLKCCTIRKRITRSNR